MRSTNLCFILFVLLALFFLSDIAESTDKQKKLTGFFYIHGKTLVDPPKDEPKDTHINFYLTGESAKSLYEMMNVEAEENVCAGDGSKSKVVKNMRCDQLLNKKEYECYFSIDVMRETLHSGGAC